MTLLRFAPIIRVSTEKQKEKGESLETQKTQIKQYVHSLNGVILEHCWQYTGQEHATPNQERQKLEKLLVDSSKQIFDAVIVCDASRWSRDNLKSKTGLEILRKNGIRFFVGTMEYDLFNPEHKFYLGISAEIGELQARQQALKSITNRIEKAKRGIPTAGKLPYGRTYDDEKGWDIDKEKQRKIKQAAARFLKGESFKQIAATLGMKGLTLWDILTRRCGDKWKLNFRVDNLNVNEDVEITVPRLLDETTIEAIHERTRANKTYSHGELKHRYLLSRMIFCGKCGGALSGQAPHVKRYYKRPQKCRENCHYTKFVPADLIENSVLIQLIRTFGDVERLEEAVKKATPDMKKQEELAKEREDLEKELKKVLDKQKAVIDAIAERVISKEKATDNMSKYEAQEAQIKTRLTTIEDELANIPDPAKVKRLSKFALAVFKAATKSSTPKKVFKKSYEWKRNLVEHAFGGRDSEGKRYGVYIEETGDTKQPWKFEIRGLVENTLLALPLPDEYLEEVFHLDIEFQDIDKELQSIKKSITNSAQYLPIQPPRLLKGS